MIYVAEKVGGVNHHFKFVQAPFNKTNQELQTLQEQKLDGSPDKINVMDACQKLGLNIIGTNIYQSRIRYHKETYDNNKNKVIPELQLVLQSSLLF